MSKDLDNWNIVKKHIENGMDAKFKNIIRHFGQDKVLLSSALNLAVRKKRFHMVQYITKCFEVSFEYIYDKHHSVLCIGLKVCKSFMRI